MMKRPYFGARAQVSIEIMLLLVAIILITMAVIGHYLQIRDSTVGLQLLKVETLRQLSQAEGQYVIEKLDYSIVAGDATFIVCTEPKSPLMPLDTGFIQTIIDDNTAFNSVTVAHNEGCP